MATDKDAVLEVARCKVANYQGPGALREFMGA